MHRRAVLALPLPALLARRAAAADPAWPARPVRIVVVFPPGGASDIVSRVLADALSTRLGARFLVDNRPGAGGTLGAAFVAGQPADGHTLLASNPAPIVTSPPLYPTPGYDPVRSFAHVAYLGTTPLVITANERLVPATTLPALVEWVKAQPDPPAYGSSGIGSVGHILGVMFERETGARLTHVPYRGSAPMQVELLGGSLPLGFDVLPENVENIRAGRLRAIAVTSPARQPMAPEVATTAEGGLPGLVGDNWLGLSAPAGTPPAITERLATETIAALSTPEVRRRLEERGITGAPLGPAAFTALVERQVRDLGGLVRSLGIRPE